MTSSFKKTQKQVDATKLMGDSRYKYIMCYGGSRSGKTFNLCRAIIIRALKKESRHLVTRLNFNHAKTALWMDTFPKVFKLCFPNLKVHQNKTDYFYTLPNGSEIWIGGLDNKERVEKILGREYSTIYFNECSQIPYESITTAITRLAESSGLALKAYYDENPPNKRHWSYYVFKDGIDPESSEPLSNADKYAHILMNPNDNKENLPDGYIEDTLENLPEKQRKRFLLGEFGDDDDGSVYYAFDRSTNVGDYQRASMFPIMIGMDFNINPMTATICQVIGDTIFVLDEFYIMGSDTPEMAESIKAKYGAGHRIVPDSTGKRKQTSSSGMSDHLHLKSAGFQVVSTNNPFRIDRYNTVNNLLEKGRIKIDKKCVRLIRDLERVSYKEGSSLPDTSKDSTLTHISDGLGYLAYYTFPLLAPSDGVTMLPR